jgi:hypothetical protein
MTMSVLAVSVNVASSVAVPYAPVTKHRELGGTLPPRIETLEDDVAIGQLENVGAVEKPLKASMS